MNAEKRLSNLRVAMKNADVDIVCLAPGPNLRHLTGAVHYLLERPILLFIPQEGKPIAIIPQLEVTLFQHHPLDYEIFSWADAEGYDNAYRKGFEALDVQGKTIGVDGMTLRFFEGEIIRKYATSANVIGFDDQLSDLRLIKDADEIAALQKAVEISEAALRSTLDQVKIGMTEIQIGDILDREMKALGSEEVSFKTIMHGGANTALPHTGPLDYAIQPGDLLLFDFGATYQGYRADITRMIFLSEPSAEVRTFYEVVQAANEAARCKAGPGIPAEEVDLTAKQVITEAGFAHLLRHRTGHGLGLLAHEAPYIVEGNKQVLQPGMIFTIEPGIYELDNIGVRIEDDILITEDGSESLTTFPRDIYVLG